MLDLWYAGAVVNIIYIKGDITGSDSWLGDFGP